MIDESSISAASDPITQAHAWVIFMLQRIQRFTLTL